MSEAVAQLFEDVVPNPEFLIKSIAEQGYSFESAIADLIDNSISADCENVEILVDTDKEPFLMYLADDGKGMSLDALKNALKFPSASSEEDRKKGDLGRFGLGLKTASFSQTRKFTVLSREDGSEMYHARTWDVDLLKTHSWKIIVNNEIEVEKIIENYKSQSEAHFNGFEKFRPNTIVVWSGLFKFEKYLEQKNRKDALRREVSEIMADHLSMVFHRFMQRVNRQIKIRVNNKILKPFNPFPTEIKGFRSIPYKERNFHGDSIKIEGFVLPASSIEEVKSGENPWTTKNKSLMDMEGVYIYRGERLISFGGWNGIIKKEPRLQLARVRVEVGTNVDHLLHLNVAKSKVIIPHDLKLAFENYIGELKIQAEREFYNRKLNKFDAVKSSKEANLFIKKASNRGILIEINENFPVVSSLMNNISHEQKSKLKFLIKSINVYISKLRGTDEVGEDSLKIVDEQLSIEDLQSCIKVMKAAGYSNSFIKSSLKYDLNFNIENISDEIQKVLGD